MSTAEATWYQQRFYCEPSLEIVQIVTRFGFKVTGYTESQEEIRLVEHAKGRETGPLGGQPHCGQVNVGRDVTLARFLEPGRG